ncbi:alpha/beta hydrolase [Flavobacteriaceae bacterium M23B6Z8]
MSTKSNLSLLFFLCLGILLVAPCQAQESWKITRDILYYENDSVAKDPYVKQQCNLDIYHPTDSLNAPVVIWFHGGGLTSGKKQIPDGLKKQGLIIVGVGYRLSPKVKAESCIDDATAAVAWVLNHINNYNGNTKKVFVSGHSAGGYLAAMTVMDTTRLAAYDLDANEIAGLIPFSGHTITHFTIRKQRGIEGTQPIIDEFAPLFYVRAKAPPILLLTGDREKELLGRYEEVAYFYRMLKVAGHQDVTLYELEGYGHQMVVPGLPLLIEFVKARN